ncbi:MAG TPA: energy-coupling factor ABC transporter ATP-binding protein [Gemmataceae bacterium]|nr:energy-coupling factor ABC transporter ATP-binding protein [Gemmataceae bacterium]
MIDVEGLDFTYPDGKRALHDLRFHVQAGESVGLGGPNGAGKTTLFLCLAGVLAPQSGTMQVVALDPREPSERKQLPARVGIVFQNSDEQLFSTTISDDVAFGPLNLGLDADEVKRRVTQALTDVGLAGFEERVPFHLSGGEKRRAALAGVLAMRPQVLMLDEPSMFLDPRGRRELIHLLNALPITKIIASHDLEMILDTCQRVAVLDAGRLITMGPAAEVLRDRALMETHGLEVPYRLRENV